MSPLICILYVSPDCNKIVVKIVDGRLHFLFVLFTLFYFFFFFLFLEQLGLGVISHAVTSVTRLIMGLERME